MRIEPELSSVSIVLVGSFNPSIFQPFWLQKHGLLSEQAAESANISVLHQEISNFSIDSEFIFTVQRDRFVVVRSVAPFVTASDVCSRIFGDLLPHTPIQQLGINRTVHFSVGSWQERNRIGDLLAPKEPWGSWAKGFHSKERSKRGGLQSMIMINKQAPDREAGHVMARIEPSNAIGKGEVGIFMEVNDHYEFDDPMKTTDALPIISILQRRFDVSIALSESIIDQIMSLKK
jgi:hypothetical protein